MPNLFRFFAIAAVGVALSACAGVQLDRTKGIQPVGSTYDKALFAEYIALSQTEYDEADYKDSDVFALRARAAANMEKFPPEEISARTLPADKVGELKEARYRVLRSLAAGAADKAPKPAAKAQAMFDCWMQEQEENFQPEDIAACRAQFLTAMSEIDAALQEKPKMAAPKPAPAPAPKPMALPGPFTVFFDFDSAALNASGTNTVGQASAAIKEAAPNHIVVIGHADRAGSDAYNNALSAKRADAIAKAIMESGAIAGARIVTQAKGESEPRIATPDGQREPANRRGTIELKK